MKKTGKRVHIFKRVDNTYDHVRVFFSAFSQTGVSTFTNLTLAHISLHTPLFCHAHKYPFLF